MPILTKPTHRNTSPCSSCNAPKEQSAQTEPAPARKNRPTPAYRKLTFNSIADAVIFADTRRQIIMVNPAFIAMFGYEPDEVKGRTTEFLYTDSRDYEKQGQKR
jgi:PAS domain-containing protein